MGTRVMIRTPEEILQMTKKEQNVIDRIASALVERIEKDFLEFRQGEFV